MKKSVLSNEFSLNNTHLKTWLIKSTWSNILTLFLFLLCVLAAPLDTLSAGGLNVFAFHISYGTFSSNLWHTLSEEEMSLHIKKSCCQGVLIREIVDQKLLHSGFTRSFWKQPEPALVWAGGSIPRQWHPVMWCQLFSFSGFISVILRQW